MKKTFGLSIIFLILCLSLFCIIGKADVFVSPAELKISMNQDYMQGNTTTKITVTNKYDYNISVKAKMMHPDILRWMRPNRTLIDNLSWISIKPSSMVIPAQSNGKFYIHLNIPNESWNQTLDQHWETWAALKINMENSSLSLGQGYLVRVYVDTPASPPEPEEPSSSEQMFYDTILAVFIALLVIIVLYYYKTKNRK